MKREKKTILCSNIFLAKRSLALAVTFVIIAGFLYVSRENSKNIQEEFVINQEITITKQPKEPLVTDREQIDVPKNLCCYVCGAVKKPGVYTFSQGARMNELIEQAGGFTKDAAVTYLNLAKTVTDSEKIYVPTKDEVTSFGANESVVDHLQEGTTTESKTGAEDKVNINTADIDKLTSLPGIGEAKAGSIISYREDHGAFQSIEELKNVEGIKDGVFNKIKDLISVQ